MLKSWTNLSEIEINTLLSSNQIISSSETTLQDSQKQSEKQEKIIASLTETINDYESITTKLWKQNEEDKKNLEKLSESLTQQGITNAVWNALFFGAGIAIGWCIFH